MMAYEFYLHDGCGKTDLIGILPERRKNARRITRKSTLNWGKLIVGAHADPKSIDIYSNRHGKTIMY
jgi:hypothetical protein